MLATLQTLDWCVERIDRLARFVASLVRFSIMLIVFVDVGFRYFLNAPLSWSFDLISVYLMAAIFFIPLSDTLRRNHHISVDLLFVRMPRRTQRLARLLGNVLAAIAFFLVTMEAMLRTGRQFAGGDILAGSIPWPTWVATALVAFGAGLLTLRLVIGAVALLLALVTRSEQVVGIDETVDPLHDAGAQPGLD